MKKIVQITDKEDLIYPITTTDSISQDTYGKNLYEPIRHLIVTPLIKGRISIGTAQLSYDNDSDIISECAMVVPYAGVTINIRLPKGIQIKFIYGKFASQPSDNTAHSQDEESETLVDGSQFTFDEEYDLYRVMFLGTKDIKYIEQCLKDGSISLTYTNSYGDIINNNKYNEQFVHSIMVQSVNNYTIKYLPTFAHASDFHCDVIRLQNFLDYCDYLKLKVAVITGDFCAQITSDGFSYALEQFNKHNVIPIICPGNHDKATGYNSTTVPKYDTFFKEVAKKYNYNTNGGHYYYLDVTLESQPVRFISLDQYETNSYGYNVSQKQTLWLIETLKNTPANYKVFIAMHQKEVQIVKDIESGNFYEETMAYDDSAYTDSGLQRGNILFNIVKLYQKKAKNTTNLTVSQPKNGDSFTINSGAIDFTNTNGQFVAFLSGHTHRDTIGINKADDDTRQLHLNISCDNTSRYNLRDLPVNKGKSHNSDLFNIYSIDNSYVYIARVGSFVSHETNERLHTRINYLTTPSSPGKTLTEKDIVQQTGTNTNSVMSQKAVTVALDNKTNKDDVTKSVNDLNTAISTAQSNLKAEIATKQDLLSAGVGIRIADNVVSAREEVLYDDYFYPNKSKTTDTVRFTDSYEVLQPTAYVGDYTDADGVQWQYVWECEGFPDWFDYAEQHCYPYGNGVSAGGVVLKTYTLTDAGELRYNLYGNKAAGRESLFNSGSVGIKKIDDTHFTLYQQKGLALNYLTGFSKEYLEPDTWCICNQCFYAAYDVTECKRLRIEISGQTQSPSRYATLLTDGGNNAQALRGYVSWQCVYGTIANVFEFNENKTQYRVLRSTDSLYYRTSVTGAITYAGGDFVMNSKWIDISNRNEGLRFHRRAVNGEMRVFFGTNYFNNPSLQLYHNCRVKITKLE